MPESLKNVRTHYCPGCSHGIIHKILAECIDELNMRENTVGVSPVGCAVIAYEYLNLDMVEALHGRAPAIATGLKRALPDKLVFTYQGDGDLLAIGISELIHAANRGENFTIIFVNNRVYGMTGGQMAPTTAPGQKTLTTPYGRDGKMGEPIDVMHLIEPFSNVKYLARGAVYHPNEIRKTKNLIKRALEMQISGDGFSLVEVLATCPTYWRMSPGEAMDYVKDNIAPHVQMGVIKEQ
jgi:2-oxoglutarate ferredoxin oxidoreductase subunit beta